jgi:hypothetical protein
LKLVVCTLGSGRCSGNDRDAGCHDQDADVRGRH